MDTISRRAAILASLAIATPTTAYIAETELTSFMLVLPFGSRDVDGSQHNCQPSGDGRTVRCETDKIPEPKWALTIKYGARTIRLTANEIMDALDGIPRGEAK